MSNAQNASPMPSDFPAFATAWQRDGVTRLLNYVWTGYDALRLQNPSTLNPHDEINVNSHLESWIQRKKPKKCPFDIQHTPPEVATRLTKSRPPPSPDFGFFSWTDRRAMFPLEAKVLRTDTDVSAYLKALRSRFLRCRYAPYSSEGVMIGYLLAGDPAVTFKKLRERLRTQLLQHPDFISRPHRVSSHQRKHRLCKKSPVDFRCHHLVMTLC
jgi:hypothetical protein